MSESMERYYWLKAHGICTECGCEDAAEGKTKCLNCLDRHAIRQMQYKASHMEKAQEGNKERCRVRYEKLKAEGLCVNCGRRKPEHGVVCDYCRGKRKVQYFYGDVRQRRKEERRKKHEHIQ